MRPTGRPAALAAVVAAGLAAIGAWPGPAAAGAVASVAAPSKKQRLLQDKAQSASRTERAAERAQWSKVLRRRLGQKPPALINIYNTWTHEVVALDPKAGESPPPELVSRFFRCHFTNHAIAMDARLFGVLLKAAGHFKVPRVEIVSGFRAPKYNLMLRKKGRRVARQSEHTFGNAVDFRLPGVTTERLRTWARRQRLGGVGYYQEDGFVHVDTGPVRYWAE